MHRQSYLSPVWKNSYTMKALNKIGITERGDAALNTEWLPWVRAGKPAILITKDPQLLYHHLEEFGAWNPNVIVHCTITGFGGTILEPNVPPYQASLNAYEKMVTRYGADRVVLRIDPVIPTPKGIDVAMKVLVRAYTIVRISFIDNYDHVKQRMLTAGVPLPWNSLHAPIEIRINAWQELQKLEQARSDRTGIEICGEPDFECTGCVSDKDCKVLDVTTKTQPTGKQRPACACLALKHELLSNRTRCPHKCLYCYWSSD